MNKIGKSLVKDIIRHLRCYPELARAFREALSSGEEFDGKGESKKHVNRSIPYREWVSASQAGSLIGKSGCWVRQHIELFPSSRFEKRGEKGKWWFDKNEVKEAFDAYIRINTQMSYN